MNTTDKIMALANTYASSNGKALLEKLYGTSQSYAEQCAAEAFKDRQALRAEIETLVRNAERYRHLRDGVLVDGEINKDMYVHVDHPSYPNRWALIGDELDEAVDNAMQEKQS